MHSQGTGSGDPFGEQRLRDAARALADAAGQFGQSLGNAGAQAETGVTKGLLAAAQALAQASAWVEQRSRPLSTKEKLLEQAARLFAERGYSGVSLEDIAQAAGFTKGAVYSHFGSKEQTFLAALRAETELLDLLRQGPSGEPGAAGDLGDRAGAAGLVGAGGSAGAAGVGRAAAGVGEAVGDADADAYGGAYGGADGGAAEAGLAVVQLSQGVNLLLEAMLFGQRTPERRDEVRDITQGLIAALAAAQRAAVTGQEQESRVLDADERAVAELALRSLLRGLAS